tara:strand:+ start:144 stop:683 length:540 start_codon:yes stop_codon:yes gene_type:complete
MLLKLQEINYGNPPTNTYYNRNNKVNIMANLLKLKPLSGKGEELTVGDEVINFMDEGIYMGENKGQTGILIEDKFGNVTDVSYDFTFSRRMCSNVEKADLKITRINQDKLKESYEDGKESGLKFDNTEHWNYTPGGPYSHGHRRNDSKEMSDKVDQNIAEIKAWWKGYNETCHPKLKRG